MPLPMIGESREEVEVLAMEIMDAVALTVADWMLEKKLSLQEGHSDDLSTIPDHG